MPQPLSKKIKPTPSPLPLSPRTFAATHKRLQHRATIQHRRSLLPKNRIPFLHQSEHQKNYSPRKELYNVVENVPELPRNPAPFVSPLQSTSHAAHSYNEHNIYNYDDNGMGLGAGGPVAGRPNDRARSIFDFTRGKHRPSPHKDRMAPPPSLASDRVGRNKLASGFYHNKAWQEKSHLWTSRAQELLHKDTFKGQQRPREYDTTPGLFYKKKSTTCTVLK